MDVTYDSLLLATRGLQSRSAGDDLYDALLPILLEAAQLKKRPISSCFALTASAIFHPFRTTYRVTRCALNTISASKDVFVELILSGDTDQRLELIRDFAASLALGPAARIEEYERLTHRARLYENLSQATSRAEYEQIASELQVPALQAAHRAEEESEDDDFKLALVTQRTQRLQRALIRDEITSLPSLLQSQLKRDVMTQGIINVSACCNIQMMNAVKDYNDTVRRALDRIENAVETADSRLSRVEDMEQTMEQTRIAYGRSALCLSGGGTWGMHHIGVVKALWEEHCLPQIISGSSAGAIVAAVVCTSTDGELLKAMDRFCNGDLNVFTDSYDVGWHRRAGTFLRTWYIYSSAHLRRLMRNCLKDYTFEEAHRKTGRILNITVSGADRKSPAKCLNFKTAPDTLIWSAVVASCALPFVFEPSALVRKVSGTFKSVDEDTSKYLDGSVQSDIPADILRSEFNVSHTIVSQANLYVAPFLWFSNRVHADRWLKKCCSGPTKLVDHGRIRVGEFFVQFDVPFPLNTFTPEPLLRLVHLGGSVLGQKYTGDITVLPVDSCKHIFNVLTNPTPEFMAAATIEGERKTWRKLHAVKNALTIEKMLDEAVRKCREHAQFDVNNADKRRRLLLPRSRSHSPRRASGRHHRRAQTAELRLTCWSHPQRSESREGWIKGLVSLGGLASSGMRSDVRSAPSSDDGGDAQLDAGGHARPHAFVDVSRTSVDRSSSHRSMVKRIGAYVPWPASLSITPISPTPQSPESARQSRTAAFSATSAWGRAVLALAQEKRAQRQRSHDRHMRSRRARSQSCPYAIFLDGEEGRSREAFRWA